MTCNVGGQWAGPGRPAGRRSGTEEGSEKPRGSGALPGGPAESLSRGVQPPRCGREQEGAGSLLHNRFPRRGGAPLPRVTWWVLVLGPRRWCQAGPRVP